MQPSLLSAVIMINNSQKNMDKSFVASIRFTHDSVVEQWVGTVFTAFIVSILYRAAVTCQ